MGIKARLRGRGVLIRRAVDRRQGQQRQKSTARDVHAAQLGKKPPTRTLWARLEVPAEDFLARKMDRFYV